MVIRMDHENHPTFAAGPRCPGRKFEPPDTIAPHRPSATTTTTIRTTSRYIITKIINPSIPNAPSLFLRAGSKPITIPLQNEHTSRHKCMPDPPPPASPASPCEPEPPRQHQPANNTYSVLDADGELFVLGLFGHGCGVWSFGLAWVGWVIQKSGEPDRQPCFVASLPVNSKTGTTGRQIASPAPPPAQPTRREHNLDWRGLASLPDAEQQANWQAVTAA